MTVDTFKIHTEIKIPLLTKKISEYPHMSTLATKTSILFKKTYIYKTTSLCIERRAN